VVRPSAFARLRSPPFAFVRLFLGKDQRDEGDAHSPALQKMPVCSELLGIARNCSHSAKKYFAARRNVGRGIASGDRRRPSLPAFARVRPPFYGGGASNGAGICILRVAEWGGRERIGEKGYRGVGEPQKRPSARVCPCLPAWRCNNWLWPRSGQ
jgi:hypothetical protein